MTAERAQAPTAAPTPTLSRRIRAAVTRFRRSGDTRILTGLAAAALVTVAVLGVWPDYVPITAVALPLLLAHLALGPKELPWFVVATMLGLALVAPRQPQLSVRTMLEIITVFVLGFIILLASFRRSRLGVAGVRGESMLVDLRDRSERERHGEGRNGAHPQPPRKLARTSGSASSALPEPVWAFWPWTRT